MAVEGPQAPKRSEDDAALQRQRSIEQAIDEGHDADTPSGLGYVLDEKGERKRRASIASRAASLAKKPSNAAKEDDVERLAGGDPPGASSSDPPSEDEANVVWWNGEDDPENPFNWSMWRKVLNSGLISALTFLTPLASSIFAPGVPELMKEFKNNSPELAGFVVSIYVLGFAFGPLLLAPLSEIYGRAPVYHICNIGFIAFAVGCALAPSLEALIAFRFLSGLFGSCPITNGGGSIADMVPPESRGRFMAAFSVGPLLGPIIGPVAGGFLADAEGWRWNFWLVVILAGALAVAQFIFMRETYAPVLLQRKTEKLRKETGNEMLRSKLDIGLSNRDYFARSIVRPFRLLFLSPISIVFAIYMAVVYGYLYLLFTSITPVFQQYYGFSASIVGLVFIGLGVGSLGGLFFFSATSDPYVKRMKDLHGFAKPEYRLMSLPIGAVLLPAGLFIYGWTAQYRTHWMGPIIGTVVIGAGNIIIFMGVVMYLVDAFNIYAASALAANMVIRSIAGATLPLCALRMYNVLGMGWGNSLLAFIAMAMIPIPFVIQKYGEQLRTRFAIDL